MYTGQIWREGVGLPGSGATLFAVLLAQRSERLRSASQGWIYCDTVGYACPLRASIINPLYWVERSRMGGHSE